MMQKVAMPADLRSRGTRKVLYWVTPRLFVGDPSPHVSGTQTVQDQQEALSVILGGGVAVLPVQEASWDTVIAVLTSLGLDPATVLSRLRVAIDGRV